VLVMNTPGGNAVSVAEHTLAVMLAMARYIPQATASTKSGKWEKKKFLGSELRGKTLGIVGLGKLGARVAGVAKAFGMKVIAWSQNLTPEKCKEVGVDYVSKEDLFKQSDFITIHLVLSPRSRGIVGPKDIALMKPTAYIINTSRGPLIDEAALLAALREGKIAGAGLDVFDVEPLPLEHPYRKMDNVVLTPHLGYVAAQNYRTYFAGIVEDIRAFLDGKPVRATHLPPTHRRDRVRAGLENAFSGWTIRHVQLPNQSSTSTSRVRLFVHEANWKMRIFWVSCRSAMNFMRESVFAGARRKSGSVWRRAFATTNSDGEMPGRMVRSQDPNESQTSLGATTARYWSSPWATTPA
jgi:phosphoglycerate dehydrogenase-like enzyme